MQAFTYKVAYSFRYRNGKLKSGEGLVLANDPLSADRLMRQRLHTQYPELEALLTADAERVISSTDLSAIVKQTTLSAYVLCIMQRPAFVMLGTYTEAEALLYESLLSLAKINRWTLAKSLSEFRSIGIDWAIVSVPTNISMTSAITKIHEHQCY